MNLNILRVLLWKEFKLMRSNPLIMRVVFVLPVVVMLIMPLIATMDVRNVGVIVIDSDRTQYSSRMISDLGSTKDISVVAVCGSQREAIAAIEKGEADVIVTIPPDFSKTFTGLDVQANGVNATKGMIGAQYVVSSLAGSLKAMLREEGKKPIDAETSIINRYNPTLEYHNYMIPALMVVLIIIICGFLPALNLVNEKETGTIEAINVSPVRKFTFVLSKLIPFWMIGLLVVIIGMVIGRVVYGLAPAGSIPGIIGASILFSLVMSGLGVAIANKSSTMLQSIFVMFAFIMIFQLMSGLFTPISSMPEFAMWITYAIPPRYYIEIMRALYLKATPVSELTFQFSMLTLLATLLFTIATLTYKKQS